MKHVCENCGGELKATKVPRYDFSAYAGVAAILEGAVILKCRKCGAETLEGRVINNAMAVLVLAFVRSPNRLDQEAARFLRRSLGLTQQELAGRMGLARETVAKWETGDEISPQNDFILRQVALSGLERGGASLLEAQRDLNAVRLAPPKRGKTAPMMIHAE